jgi:hypothetical protein
MAGLVTTKRVTGKVRGCDLTRIPAGARRMRPVLLDPHEMLSATAQAQVGAYHGRRENKNKKNNQRLSHVESVTFLKGPGNANP